MYSYAFLVHFWFMAWPRRGFARVPAEFSLTDSLREGGRARCDGWALGLLLLQLIRTLTFPPCVASNRCTQSPSHSQIVLYERDW